MAQSIVPILLFGSSESKVTLQGGTTVVKSPPSLSIQNILIKLLKKFGINISFEVKIEGFYPVGKGIVEISINPVIYKN